MKIKVYQESGSPKKTVNHTPKKRGGGGEEQERKRENHVCLPLLSLFYEFIERILIMGDQIHIQRFLNISISFWAIQVPDGPHQSERALSGVCSHRCCSLRA